MKKFILGMVVFFGLCLNVRADELVLVQQTVVASDGSLFTRVVEKPRSMVMVTNQIQLPATSHPVSNVIYNQSQLQQPYFIQNGCRNGVCNIRR